MLPRGSQKRFTYSCLFRMQTVNPSRNPRLMTFSSYCWVTLLALLLLGLVLFLSFSSFPRASPLGAAAEAFGLDQNMTSLMESGHHKFVTVTQVEGSMFFFFF
jgi:hypothetical protein